jgi:hypothetical protein
MLKNMAPTVQRMSKILQKAFQKNDTDNMSGLQ